MNPKIHYLVDLLMLVAFIGIAVTSFTMKRNDSELHHFFGEILIFLIIVHIAIHWKWIVSMTKKLFRKN